MIYGAVLFCISFFCLFKHLHMSLTSIGPVYIGPTSVRVTPFTKTRLDSRFGSGRVVLYFFGRESG